MKNEIEMVRVLGVPPMGKLVVDANEERYATLADVTNPKVRQRLLAAIGELVDFCGGYKVLEDAGVVPQLLPPPVPKQAGEPELSLSEQQEAFLAQLEQQVAAEKNKPVKKGGMLSSGASTKNAQPLVEITETGEVKPASTAPKQLSIAEQIDLILQKHIATTPEMKNRGIRLEQSPTGGLQILADGKQYEKPADIEDVAVQGIIKTAVKEWNSTQ